MESEVNKVISDADERIYLDKGRLKGLGTCGELLRKNDLVKK